MPAPARRETLQLELGRDASGASIVAVLDKLPDSESQVFAFVDERTIGLAVSTLPQQINRVARVSFESAALYISAMSMATAQVPPGRERQIASGTCSSTGRSLRGLSALWRRVRAASRSPSST